MASTIMKELAKEVFTKNISKSRKQAGQSIENFKFKKDRCKILSQYDELREESKGVIYWMCRESRVQDNWALLYAQKLAIKYDVPLHVCFFLDDFKELYPTTRQFNFLHKGLNLVKDELEKLNIPFYLLKKTPLELAEIVKDNNIGCVVCDFFPLHIVMDWQNKLKDKLPEDVTFVQVDAHNIVPCWITSDKLERAARTIRPKILKQLPKYLTEFPEVCKQTETEKLDINPKLMWAEDAKLDIKFLEEIKWAEPGESGGFEMLRIFLTERLKYYGISSNDASKKHQSDLSPWIHFGQISTQRIALEVSKLKTVWKDQCEKYLEEVIVRKELCDNFCFYNSDYNNLKGADQWAQDTLNLHRSDKRSYIYTKEQFEEALTHDPIWNSAQTQLIIEGKLHGYMRMYWCKKILEWTESPEKAVEVGLYLNDTYSIDGSDPNGFVGVMWSVCGIHDQGFKERPVFGKIRFMVDYCLGRKFDVKAYCSQYKPKSNISGIKKYFKTETSEASESKTSKKRPQQTDTSASLNKKRNKK